MIKKIKLIIFILLILKHIIKIKKDIMLCIYQKFKLEIFLYKFKVQNLNLNKVLL